MPPLILAVCSWIVGTALGVVKDAAPLGARSGLSLLCGVVIGGARGVLRQERAHRGLAASCALLAIAGTWAGYTTVQRDAACRALVLAQLQQGRSVGVVLDEPVPAHALGRGLVRVDSASVECAVPTQVRLTHEGAAAGRWGTLRGRAEQRGSAVVISGRIEHMLPTRRDWRRVMRARMAAVIDRYFGRDAPVVRALLIGEQAQIDPAVRDTFATAGLIHLLSISGLHVAIIADALVTLALACRLSRSAAFVASGLVIAGYVAMLGAPAPAVRSSVMLLVMGLAERRQRPTHPWTALALGAAFPTIDPRAVVDLGWQLSVAGMAALVSVRALWRRLRTSDLYSLTGWRRQWMRRFQRLDGWRRRVLRELLTGIVATVITAPLVAWTFGRLSLIAPVSNLVAGPLLVAIQPTLFLTMLLAPWPTLASGSAAAAQVPLRLLERLAAAAASLPHAAVLVTPNAWTAVWCAVASAAWVRTSAAQRWMPGMVVAVAALVLGVWSPVLGRGAGTAEVHVMDVGQGDAIGVRTPHGRWILVDAGRRWEGGDAGRRTVIPYVRRLGGLVAAFVMTHAHEDHVGGGASVIAALRPAVWWEPGFVGVTPSYREALDALSRGRTTWHRVRPWESWTVDGVQLTVLAPDSAWTARQTDANETSVVLRVSYGQTAWLLMGDAEAGEEAWLLEHVPSALLRADVLKLGHHGSRTSSTTAFLEAVRPRLAVISVGAGNRYGHPSPSVLEELDRRQVTVLRTDLEGTIRTMSDGRRLEVVTATHRWRLP